MPYGKRSVWEIEFTPQAEQWFMGLSAHDADQIAASFDHLERKGPALPRPRAASITGSRHHNMKELRSVGGHLRALFVFDPRRRAIVLLGGDKTNDWKGWYKRNIPIADKLYDNHLRALGKERAWPTRAPQAGRRSEASGR
jgi:hypothetical protein